MVHELDAYGSPTGPIAIRLLRALGLLNPGDVVCLPARQAMRLVAEGVAEYVK